MISKDEYKLQMSENKVLRKIFGLKKYEINEQFRILYNEELGDLYRSLSIVNIMKCRRLQWAKHFSEVEETGNAYEILVVKHLAKCSLGRDGRRTLRWILRRQVVRMGDG